jgi:hypothetical protein
MEKQIQFLDRWGPVLIVEMAMSITLSDGAELAGLVALTVGDAWVQLDVDALGSLPRLPIFRRLAPWERAQHQHILLGLVGSALVAAVKPARSGRPRQRGWF